MNTWYNILGGHIPARFPIPVPDFEPLDDVPLYVTLPNSWLPHIIGMCMTLLRPETWHVDDEDAEHWADKARDLIRMLADGTTTPPGCAPPDGTWSCNYNFAASDQGFVIDQVNGQDCGEYVSNLGFRATVVDTGGPGITRYQRLLKIHKVFSSARYVYGMQVNEEATVELAPGGQDGRFQVSECLDGFGNPVLNFVTWPAVDIYNGQFLVGSDGMTPAERFTGSYTAGQDNTDATLEATQLIVSQIILYGYGEDVDCD